MLGIIVLVFVIERVYLVLIAKGKIDMDVLSCRRR